MERVVEYLGVASPEEAEEVLGIDRWRGVNVDVRRPADCQEQIDALVPSEYKNNPAFKVTGNGEVIRIHEGSDYLTDSVWYPLQEIERKEDLDIYPFPQEDWIEIPGRLEQEIQEYKDAAYVVYGAVTQPFKAAWMLRGMNAVLMDYLIRPDLINEMYDRIYAFSTARCIPLIEAGVDMIQIVGDLGMQTGLMMSPDTWRTFDKGRLKKMISTWKGIHPGLNVYMHTDGDVRAIIEDLIEVGIDILNPIQPECMDPVEIKRRYGDRLVLHGAVSLQRTLPLGSSEDVKEETQYLIRHCNVNGGFVLGPSNVLFKEIPPENIVAMYAAVSSSA
jgi:uroporphyrinogen-III decarboxylase